MRTFTFNGIRSDVFVITSKIEMPILPQIEFNTIKVTARNGLISYKSTLNARTFKIKVTLLSTTPEEMRQKCRDIAKWLYTDLEKTLFFSDEPNRTYQAKIKGEINFDQLVNLGETEINFVAVNPYASGQTLVNIALTNGGTITNAGTASAYPILYFTPTSALASGITFVNSSLQKSVVLTGAFTSGRKYKLDMTTNQVIDTVSSAKLMTQIDIDSDFWALRTGSNTISWTPSTATVIMDYTEKYY